jgi:DNA-directed RNA polymerase I, II, and III subunit RPABC1
MAALEERAALTGEASHLFRIRRTLLKMLKKRSYVVDAAQLAMTPRGFVDQFGDQPKRNDLTILAEHETDAEDQLFVFLPDDDKVGVKTIKQYCEMMKEAGVSHAILVVKQGVTPFAKTALQEMASTYLIEHFRDAELLVDVTEHRLVPAHALLSPEDRQALLDRYKLRAEQLPRIQRTDPVARYYGLKVGDVVKIVRPSETAGRYVTYRVCI